MTEIATQRKLILDHLKKGFTMTPMDGLRIAGTMKLATRVGELIKAGHPIVKEWFPLPNGKKVMSYKLKTLNP
jgi:hypothetical protein